MSPDARREPGAGLPSDQLAAKLADRDKRTPALGRLSWNGHPGLTPTYARRMGWLDTDLRKLLRDTESGALAIFDAIGPRHAVALADELRRLTREVA